MTKTKWYASVSRVGDDLYVRGFDEDGKEVSESIPYTPTLYVEHHKNYGYRSIYGKNLKPIEFHSIKEATEFADQHKNSNLKLYGNPNYHSQYIIENFSDSVDLWKRKDIRVFNIDIEVTSTEGFPTPDKAAFPITAICIHDSKSDRFVTFGYNETLGQEWNRENSELPNELLEKVVYIDCTNEQDLLRKFVDFWQKFPPNIVTGWNIETFDMPYIFNRLSNVGLNPKKLSPRGIARLRTFEAGFGEQQAITLCGVDIIDYLSLYRKNKIQESYRLDHIAFMELGERKLDYSEVGGLHNLYFENFQKFIDYNIQDVNLVSRLDTKLGLIDAQIMIAYTACVNFGDVASTVRTWDALVTKEMMPDKVIPHFHISTASETGAIPGGHVKTPMVGKHGWCMSFDVNSLYPHLIMQFNISPETLNKEFKLWQYDSQENRVNRMLAGEELGDIPENHSVSAAGFVFDNSIEGIIPRIMRRLYQERKAVKKEMIDYKKQGKDPSLLDLKQYVLKILLNSGYGAFVNKFYRWYDKRLGESITLSGQYIIQVAERELNKYMNRLLKTDNVDYVIAIDTDSNYLNLQPLVDKFFSNKSREEIVDILDKIAEEQLQKALDDGFDDAAKYLRAREQAMVMKRESIASSAFWTAKKRYSMCVWDLEGVRFKDEPKIKIQGLEAIRSSTPGACREPLLNIIKTTLLKNESDVQEYVAEFKKLYMSLPYEDIAFPRTMNNISKNTVGDGVAKGTPPHTRGAIMFNKLLKQKGLDKNWELMKEGEKGKFMYLRSPNNLGTDVISFNNTLPPELNCDQYIDREQMFKKTIIDPVQSILDPIGWSAEKRNDLISFFG
jgi:DNA polymerase elongation subunit (family B)